MQSNGMSLRPRNTQSSDISAIEFKENRVVTNNNAVDVLRKEIATLKTQMNSNFAANTEAPSLEGTDHMVTADRKMTTGNHLHPKQHLHCKAKTHSGRSFKHPMSAHKVASDDVTQIQASVLSKLDALENKIQSKSFVNANILSNSAALSEIESNKEKINIDEKLTMLEKKINEHETIGMKGPSEMNEVMTRVMNKLDALEQKVAQRKIDKNLPNFTYKDYAAEKEKLNTMMQMRQKVC